MSVTLRTARPQQGISEGLIGARNCEEPWPTPGCVPPSCPSPQSHQQQAVAVVEVEHQGLIQELIAGAHGVCAALRATARSSIICSHLTSTGSPASTPRSAGPPANQRETEPDQHRAPESSPSFPTRAQDPNPSCSVPLPRDTAPHTSHPAKPLPLSPPSPPCQRC